MVVGESGVGDELGGELGFDMDGAMGAGRGVEEEGTG